jgi:hypothetical protein
MTACSGVPFGMTAADPMAAIQPRFFLWFISHGPVLSKVLHFRLCLESTPEFNP